MQDASLTALLVHTEVPRLKLVWKPPGADEQLNAAIDTACAGFVNRFGREMLSGERGRLE